MKTKLKEFLKNESIYTAISANREFPFITPDDIPALDLMLVLDFGERIVYNPIADCNIDIIAKMITVKYGKAWDNYVLSEALANNINNRTEVSETVNNDDEVNHKGESIQKVSAYNSDDLLDDSGSNTDDLTTTTGTRERVLTEERVDVFNSFNLLGILSKDSIIAKVQRDIAGFITINIY